MFCAIVAAIETVYVNVTWRTPEIFPFQKHTPDLGKKGKKKFFITTNNQGFLAQQTDFFPWRGEQSLIKQINGVPHNKEKPSIKLVPQLE